MPLVAAAVLPHPPLIVPEIAAGAAPELNGLRAACDEAVDRVLAAEPRMVCVVGSGQTTMEHYFPFRASFAAWGVPVEAWRGTPDPGTAPLPLSVAVGVWLLRRRPLTGGPAIKIITVEESAPVQGCARLGEQIVRGTAVGLLVMGDGSACRTLKAPGYLDPRAEGYDASVTSALKAADPAALLALDPGLGTELMVAGRAPWQVLAGAAGTGGPFTGEILFDEAPYGVQYTVATWLPG